jgi:large subunit ribosomal protein L31
MFGCISPAPQPLLKMIVDNAWGRRYRIERSNENDCQKERPRMKPDIHPDYHPVVFQDATTGATFLTRSTITSSRTIEWQTPQGMQTYPLVVVEVSSDSHPFWTGGRRILDTAGQVEKFHRRYGHRR